jgi:SAM-dependent methyltransferase
MQFHNTYEDAARAASYAGIGFPGTYYLAFRDLPALFEEYVPGRRAVDFGCGAGRSTRFLRRHGFRATGIDISDAMLRHARRIDGAGSYVLVAGDGPLPLRPASSDLVLSAFAFDNIPGEERRTQILRDLASLLAPGGRIVILVSAPELYVREWASFTTAEFPGNRAARSGESVWIVMKDGPDRRPIHDLVWHDDAYRRQFEAAGLVLLATHRPLGTEDEPFEWVNETRVSPWTIYVVAPAGA